MGMKRVEIKSKIVSRGGMAEATASAKAASVDLSGYLPKSTWERVFKFVTDEAGNEHIFSNMPFALKYGLTMYADDGSLNLPDIFRGLPIDNVTLYWDNGVLKAMGGGAAGGGGVADSVLWANVIGKPVWLTDAKPTYAWGEISERPTKLSQFTDDVVSGKYLPLGGGTLSNTLQIGSANNTSFMALQLVRSGSGVRLNNTNANAYLSFNTVDSNSVFTAQNTLILGNDGFKYSPDGQKTLYSIWHEGNFKPSDYLTLSGGTLTNTLFISRDASYGLYINNTAKTNSTGYSAMMFQYGGANQVGLLGDTNGNLAIIGADFTNKRILLHSGNIGDYNAGSATKLQTARTIWGQNFDGTGNVSGSLTMDNNSQLLGKDSGGSARSMVELTNSNNFLVGYGMGGAGYSTHVYGYDIYMHYGASRAIGLTMTKDGNVGIGTTSPSCKLHVAGDILATGGITTESHLDINGAKLTYNKTGKYWKIEGDLLVTGGVSMYSSDSAFTPSTIMDGVVVDGVTIKKNASGALYFAGTIDGGVAASVAWENVQGKPSFASVATSGKYGDLSGTPDLSVYALASSLSSYQTKITSSNKLAYSLVSGVPTLISSFTNDSGFITSSAIPTKLSQFTDDVVSGKYLPLGGGTLSNTLQIGSANNTSFMALQLVRSGSGVRLNNTNANAYLSFNTVDSNSVFTAQNTLILGNDGFKYSPDGQKTLYSIWHEGNFKPSDYLTLSGGTLTNTLFISRDASYGLYINNTAKTNSTGYSAMMFQYGGANQVGLLGDTNGNLAIIGADFTNKRILLHSGNIGDYNAGSATKLQTARTIWGQNFDGTGNVSGSLTMDNNSQLLGKDSGGSARSMVELTNSNNFLVGYGMGGAGYSTHVYGYDIYMHYGASRAIGLTMTKDGNVGIGTTSPSAKLHVAGDILATGGITMYSMRALKDVVDERGLSLDELVQIKPTRYTWKDGRDDRLHIGGIADDVRKVLPEVVYETAEGVLTMDYGNAAFAVAASLIQPVMSHEERISMLEKENRELKIEVERLKKN